MDKQTDNFRKSTVMEKIILTPHAILFIVYDAGQRNVPIDSDGYYVEPLTDMPKSSLESLLYCNDPE